MLEDTSSPSPIYVDLERFRVPDNFRGKSRLMVQLWWIVQDMFIRPSPQFLFGWRRFLWRLFGAEVGENVLIRPSARVTYPWKVKIGPNSWIGDHAELYSLGPIEIGANVIVSQDVYVCTATHNYLKIDFPLVVSAVRIEDQVWIAAGSFIAPGVTIGRGSVVGARSVVLKSVPPATVCAGHPAEMLKPRDVSSQPDSINR